MQIKFDKLAQLELVLQLPPYNWGALLQRKKNNSFFEFQFFFILQKAPKT